MSNLNAEAHLSEARKFVSAAAYDAQQVPEDTQAKQAIHNIVNALESIIGALDALASNEE
jgi:alpha-galactosidase/6-phospho-beta-glucosidase family protein